MLPAVPARSVLVIDRATYHTTLTKETQPAKSTFRKQEFAEWLVSHGVQYNGMKTVDDYLQLKRVELAYLCKQNTPVPIYQVAVLAQRANCDILLLPVAHPELNPIEMVWAYVKGEISRKNVDFSLKEVERLAHEALDGFKEENWVNYVAHCIKIEDKYLEAADEIPIEMDVAGD